MAIERINLTDGTTTIDLFAGDIRLRDGGMNIGMPKIDGTTWGNRTISLTLKCTGSSLADLKTNLREVNRLLTDARERFTANALLTSSKKVYIELQWGDSAGQSTYFEVVGGQLGMPNNFWSTHLITQYTVIDAVLTLECKPFGFYTAQNIAQETLENMDNGANHNYQDVAMAEAQGDVQAGLYLKIAHAGATGAKKTWLAKRSGARYNDGLWFEAEAATWTLLHALDNGATITNSSQADAACSAGNYDRLRLLYNGNFSAGALGYLTLSMATAPRGIFRILARCKTVPAVHTPYTDMGVGFGYSYGAKTYAPTPARSEIYIPGSDYSIIDLGLVQIPPVAESDVAGNSSFDLRIYLYQINAHSTYGEAVDWCLDYIFLLPVDEGVVIINSVASTDTLAIDSITSDPNVFKISADKVTDYPSSIGSPFTLGRENTRIYILRDDVPAVTFVLDTKYQPRFMLL